VQVFSALECVEERPAQRGVLGAEGVGEDRVRLCGRSCFSAFRLAAYCRALAHARVLFEVVEHLRVRQHLAVRSAVRKGTPALPLPKQPESGRELRPVLLSGDAQHVPPTSALRPCRSTGSFRRDARTTTVVNSASAWMQATSRCCPSISRPSRSKMIDSPLSCQRPAFISFANSLIRARCSAPGSAACSCAGTLAPSLDRSFQPSCLRLSERDDRALPVLPLPLPLIAAVLRVASVAYRDAIPVPPSGLNSKLLFGKGQTARISTNRVISDEVIVPLPEAGDRVDVVVPRVVRHDLRGLRDGVSLP
jgi:hypothetical protein